MPLTRSDYEKRLAAIKSERRRGVISARDAYERHMRLLSEARPRPELEMPPRLEISGGWAIKKVWYLPAERGLANPALAAYSDIGVLHIGDDAVVFDGTRQIVIENPRLVTYSRQGSNLVNNWVKVVYGNGPVPEVALFADGRYGGWGGLFGGTKRIFEAIEPLALNTRPAN